MSSCRLKLSREVVYKVLQWCVINAYVLVVLCDLYCVTVTLLSVL